MNDQFSFLGLAQHFSSAKQVGDMAKVIQHEAKEKAVKRRGAEAQIESIKILAEQQEELEVMKVSLNALLAHNLEQAKQQWKDAQERNNIESERFRENLRFSKIAAWTGIVGILIGLISLVIQFMY